MSCKPPKNSLSPSLQDLCVNAKHMHICELQATAIDARLCDGTLVSEDVSTTVRTIPHADYVQRVEICANTAAAQTPNISILCDPVTEDKVIVVVTFDPITLLPTVTAYNLDGTPYVGVITSLVSCPNEQFDVTQGDPWCDGGTTIVPYTIFDVTNNPPTILSVIWADLNGITVIPSGAQTPGACSTITTVMDSQVLTIPLAGSVSYGAFAGNVKTITVHNLTNDIIIVTPTFVNAVIGNSTHHIAPGSAEEIDYDRSFMSDVTITDSAILGNGGGRVIVNLTDD